MTVPIAIKFLVTEARDLVVTTASEHAGTVKAAGGVTLAGLASYISPFLTVVVLLLTAFNLALEIRKKLRK